MNADINIIFIHKVKGIVLHSNLQVNVKWERIPRSDLKVWMRNYSLYSMQENALIKTTDNFNFNLITTGKKLDSKNAKINPVPCNRVIKIIESCFCTHLAFASITLAIVVSMRWWIRSLRMIAKRSRFLAQIGCYSKSISHIGFSSTSHLYFSSKCTP